MGNVPGSVWIFSVIIIVLVTWITLWVTRKAYSKKWDETDE
ncbi:MULTISPECIES: hypothetical protein [Paenibacillus]|jgi:hypothetical protein|uniref:Uncharacterized protein n=1 Tax=Paenibacillus agaridevorans TaxID=171404 RepID=A0A2R5EQS3_9BACL|nr:MULTISPECIES: hypothetical protein [Paenibacillus]GBG06113.1 hypothetical protein PAT3040_00616 [Paenibacillus agaridevorans]